MEENEWPTAKSKRYDFCDSHPDLIDRLRDGTVGVLDIDLLKQIADRLWAGYFMADRQLAARVEKIIQSAATRPTPAEGG